MGRHGQRHGQRHGDMGAMGEPWGSQGEAMGRHGEVMGAMGEPWGAMGRHGGAMGRHGEWKIFFTKENEIGIEIEIGKEMEKEITKENIC